MELNWIDGFEIKVRIENGAAVITANREGLLSLADHLKSLAEELPGNHIHLDAYNSLEEGSSELLLEKIGYLRQKSMRGNTGADSLRPVNSRTLNLRASFVSWIRQTDSKPRLLCKSAIAGNCFVYGHFACSDTINSLS